jgi:two-component system chemotaxis response regulator CheB
VATTRVLVVDDSLTVRRRLCEVLEDDDEMEVVGEGATGEQAIELCRALRPDLVTMDMVLPVMSGLAATEYIMAHFPTPVLIVSSATNRGALFRTYDALEAGAVDVLEKPDGTEVGDDWDRAFLAAARMASRIRVITHPRGRRDRPDPAPAPPGPIEPRHVDVIAIGASTGGPGAIVEVLRGLPADLALPILFVLHISDPFGTAFAEWLGDQTGRTVRFAEEGQPLERAAGSVVMAPPDHHLVVRGRRLHLSDQPERHSCRPSIDVLFESVAVAYGSRAVGCLLTGMGRDGAAGLLAIRRRGGATIAQDEATSVVYGMPREAVLLGAVDRLLPLPAIGAALGAATRKKEPEHR